MDAAVFLSMLSTLMTCIYYMIALLRHFKEALEELEQSEIRTLLLRMPMLDMNEASQYE